MSFDTKPVKNVPFLSKAANEFITSTFSWIIPNEKLIADLPFSTKDIKLNPFYASKKIHVDFANAILNFNVRSDDIFICSLPKCGSSWMQTIVWLLTHNLNYEINQTVSREKLTGDFDEHLTSDAAKVRARELLSNDKTNSLSESAAREMAWNEIFNRLESPRIIKSHSPVFFLPKSIWKNQSKIIYIVRNPKDAAVSGYHFARNYFHVDVTMDDVVDGMTNDSWSFSPRIDHVLNYWRITKHMPNALFVYYEDLITEPFASIKTISEFLGFSYTDEELKKLCEYISFDKMKHIKTINRESDVATMEHLTGKKRSDAEFTFLRKGKIGGFRDELNKEQIQKIDDWTDKNLKDSGFRFKY